MNGQAQRILARLQATPNQDVPAVELHRAGSGSEHGWCASISRRISDLRKQGHDVVLSRDETVNGQRHTWYKLITNSLEKEAHEATRNNLALPA